MPNNLHRHWENNCSVFLCTKIIIFLIKNIFDIKIYIYYKIDTLTQSFSGPKNVGLIKRGLSENLEYLLRGQKHEGISKESKLSLQEIKRGSQLYKIFVKYLGTTEERVTFLRTDHYEPKCQNYSSFDEMSRMNLKSTNLDNFEQSYGLG